MIHFHNFRFYANKTYTNVGKIALIENDCYVVHRFICMKCNRIANFMHGNVPFLNDRYSISSQDNTKELKRIIRKSY